MTFARNPDYSVTARPSYQSRAQLGGGTRGDVSMLDMSDRADAIEDKWRVAMAGQRFDTRPSEIA